MASNKKQEEEKTSIDNLNAHLVGAGRFVEEKKKAISWITGGVLVIVCVALAYVFLIRNPRLDKSFDEYAAIEVKTMGNDSLATLEYIKVADKYNGDGGGNLAALEAGERLYDQGKYEQAVKYLKMFSADDDVMTANVECLIGDCYVNLKKYDEALNYFDKAISADKENPQIVPRVLMKKANVYDEQKKYESALKCYEQIKSEYPNFYFGVDIDAYIERENARLGK